MRPLPGPSIFVIRSVGSCGQRSLFEGSVECAVCSTGGGGLQVRVRAGLD